MNKPAAKPLDLDDLRRRAIAASQVTGDTPEREGYIYYGWGRVPDGKEPLVCTTHCEEWTHFLALATPENILKLLDAVQRTSGYLRRSGDPVPTMDGFTTTITDSEYTVTNIGDTK